MHRGAEELLQPVSQALAWSKGPYFTLCLIPKTQQLFWSWAKFKIAWHTFSALWYINVSMQLWRPKGNRHWSWSSLSTSKVPKFPPSASWMYISWIKFQMEKTPSHNGTKQRTKGSVASHWCRRTLRLPTAWVGGFTGESCLWGRRDPSRKSPFGQPHLSSRIQNREAEPVS